MRRLYHMFSGCICVSGKIANFTSMEYRYCICRCGSDDCRDFVRAKLQYRKMEEKVDFLYSSFVFVLAKVNPGINISVRSYGNYGAWSVLLFILVGICGSILCMWAGAMIESMWLGKILAYIGEKYGGDPYFSYIYITKYGSNSRKNNGTSAAGKWMEFMLPDRADYRCNRIVSAVKPVSGIWKESLHE